jgi:hypothetical protein
VRSAAGPLQMSLFRRGRVDRGRTAGRQLAESPGEAHRQILDMLDGRARQAPTRAHDEPSLLPRRRSANA